MSTAGPPRPFAVLLKIAALWLAIGHTTAANADPIWYQFAGTITSVDASTGISQGSQFTGTFSFDAAVAPTDFMGSDALYTHPYSPPHSGGPGMTLSVGGQKLLDHPALLVSSAPNPASPTKLTITEPGFGWVNGRAFHTDLELVNPTGVVYGMFGPTSMLSLANFSEAKLKRTVTQTLLESVT
ncbi:hypothetical protein SAMN05444166_2006 [Singulisphaera sp. GP187]|uniref:hypothetical protein n=1 Tax=Singulisphaera sp. GP187 TaxID=1882752 RepID=UPI0009261E61|nr:hypothetical protein [Singulisphaera sp. GP187]SIO00647.1 hypothetical protein SAMN05444166_2006 [Singulisphaera sp. GP187]